MFDQDQNHISCLSHTYKQPQKNSLTFGSSLLVLTLSKLGLVSDVSAQVESQVSQRDARKWPSALMNQPR